jgi:hypothetical protein
MSKLSTTDLKSLRDAFIACDSIRDSQKLTILVNRLIESYPGLNCLLPLSDYNIFLLRLIDTTSQYNGSLIFFITELDDLFECGSYAIQNLRATHARLYSPPPPDNARVKFQENYWVISTSISTTITIPSEFPLIADDTILNAMQPLRTWKKVHTVCEILARNYIDVYKCILDEEVETAIYNLTRFHTICKDYLDQLIKLKSNSQTVFAFEPIQNLVNVEFCIEPLIEAIRSQQNSAYFQLGKKFAYVINDLLFEALRLADRILQAHLDQEQFS